MTSEDPLEFKDSKPYSARLEAAKKKTGLNDALRVASGEMNGTSCNCLHGLFIYWRLYGVCSRREDCKRVLTMHLKKAFHLYAFLSQVEQV